MWGQDELDLNFPQITGWIFKVKGKLTASWKQLCVKLTPSNPHLYSKKGVWGGKVKIINNVCNWLWISGVINVNFYQILVHVTVIFRNLIFVCITIKDKLIKHLYNSHLRKLPTTHGEFSIMAIWCQQISITNIIWAMSWENMFMPYANNISV